MKENSSQQLHMLRYTLTEQLIHGMEVSNLAYDLARELGYEKEICYELAKAPVTTNAVSIGTISERLYWRIT